VGGVRLNLANEEAIAKAFDELIATAQEPGFRDKIDGVLIQPMIKDGVETMMGIVHDPRFGPLIAFGLGGVHAEILEDVHFRIAPLTDRDADELVRQVRGYRLLEGYRGHPPADLDALKELLLRLSRLAEELPQITELDLNPVIAMSPGTGCRVVDARIRVAGSLNWTRADTIRAPH